MLFPLKVTEEGYNAGMGVSETRYVIRFNDNTRIAQMDYLETSDVDKLNKYVKSLEDEIKRLKE